MRIIVTGAGGFVGRHVLVELTDHEVVSLDVNLDSIPDAPNITKIQGNLQDPGVIASAFSNGCDAVIHLATVPGGAAEVDPAFAKSVNIDATMALIDMAGKAGDCPRFVFASSIAVFGKLPHTPVIDAAPTAPSMLYGAHKLMMENWIAAQTRRGTINGISLRLPGIIARPKSPSGMKSAFLSDIFHALRSSEDCTIPVSRDSTTWLCSVKIAAKNLSIAALFEVGIKPDDTTVLTPTLQVKVSDLENEIRRQLGTSQSVVRYSPDTNLQTVFGEHPEVYTPIARSMNFAADMNLKMLVKSALSNIDNA